MKSVIIGAVIGLVIGVVLGILINLARPYVATYIHTNVFGPERLLVAGWGAVIGAIAGATRAIVEAINKQKG